MDNGSQMTAEERQRRLNKAARDYMGGKMDLAAFSAEERRLRPDYASATRTIARQEPENQVRAD